MKITLVRADLFHADGWMDRWTDMTKPIVAFHKFVNVSKNETTNNLFFCWSVTLLLLLLLLLPTTTPPPPPPPSSGDQPVIILSHILICMFPLSFRDNVDIINYTVCTSLLYFTSCPTATSFCHNTGCLRRNLSFFGRTFLRLNYINIITNTYIQSLQVMETMVRQF